MYVWKLRNVECKVLVSRITKLVVHWTSRSLSYGARLCLVKSISVSIKTCWAQLFVIPKNVIKEVEVVCRIFLWSGSAQFSSKSPVAWDRVCPPYEQGGLNIRNFQVWNMVTVLKKLWTIDKEKNRLWLRWVHSYYIKQQSIWTMGILGIATWCWKRFFPLGKWFLLMEGGLSSLKRRLSPLAQHMIVYFLCLNLWIGIRSLQGIERQLKQFSSPGC